MEPTSPEPLHRDAYQEPIWFFDADFSTETGDNEGWQSFNMSGTPGHNNYWHKALPFPPPYPDLGENAWWCGTVNSCYVQGQGYGNGWICHLERDFPLSEWSDPGDDVKFSFDHRYAMELAYDYGYLDISTDGGEVWTTLGTYNNTGFFGTPGVPADWHLETIVMDDYADMDVRLRFRVESDNAYSSQDTPDNAQHSVQNGAWQIDNMTWSVLPPAGVWEVLWDDDCEGEGDNGWEHVDLPGVGQVGYDFERRQYLDEIRTGRPGGIPGAPQRGAWIYAAVDPTTFKMEDDQISWLVSPAIDIEGLTTLEAQWDAGV